MTYDLNQLKQILVERLEKKGMEVSIIPSFIKNLATTISVNPDMNYSQLNNRLHVLGWEGFELDDHTLQLAIACFEAEGLKNLGNKPIRWFEDNFRPHGGSVEG